MPEPIKIRDFKGLVTNIDTKDANPEFLRESKNVIFRPGLAKTFFYNLEDADFEDINLTGEVVWQGVIYLDDDKYAVDLNYEPIYSETTEVYELLIEKIVAADYNEYKFYLKSDDPRYNWFFEIPDRWDLYKDYTKSDQDIIVFNNDGIVKIFLPHDNLWLGKINRQYRIGIPAEDNLIIDRLIESYEITPKRIDVDFEVEIITDSSVPIELTKGKFVISEIEYVGSDDMDAFPLEAIYWCRFIDANGVPIINYGRLEAPHWPRIGNSTHAYVNTDFALIKLANNNNIYAFRQDFYSGTSDYKGTEYIIMDEALYGGPFQISIGPHPTENFYLFNIIGMQFSNNQFNYGYNEFRYTSGKNLSNAGFENLYGYVEIVGTIFMDQTEFVVHHTKVPLIALPGNFALKLYNITYPPTMSKRSTGSAFYAKFQNQTDFEQFYYLNFQSKVDSYQDEIYLNAESPNGFFLSQMIGVLFDPQKFKLLKGFQGYKEVSGVAYALKSNRIYFPAVGNGLVLNDVFYPNFTIPGFYAERILKLTDVGKYLGVHTSKGLQIVVASDSRTGTFLFTIKDTMGYAAETSEAIIEAFDGVIMLTKRGIFVTNGSQDLSISKEIDDIIETTYQNGLIYIDETNKFLYYFIKNQDTVYLYDYHEKKWTQLLFPTSGITKIFEGKDNQHYFKINGAIKKLVESSEGEAIITTQSINLQDPTVYKIIEKITLDFVGKVILNGEEVEHSIRKEKNFYISLDYRIPEESFEVSLKMINGTILYLIQIQYDVIGEPLENPV